MDINTQSSQSSQPSPMPWEQPSQTAPQMPQMPVTGGKFGSKMLWVILGLSLVAGGLAWWYVNNMMAPKPFVQQGPVVDQEERQDTLIGNEIKEVDLGDLDKEFQEIDKDLNSL